MSPIMANTRARLTRSSHQNHNNKHDETMKQTRKPTIWEVLQLKLGRNPTNAECEIECKRIMAEARIERGKA